MPSIFVQYAKLTNGNFCDTIMLQIKENAVLFTTIYGCFWFEKLEVFFMKKYIIGVLVAIVAPLLSPIQVFAVENIDNIIQFLNNIF